MSRAHLDTDDLVVIGAGAAGLATAVFAARAAPRLRIRCLDGARRVGAKILVSGGSRCNVTNRVVTERDFWGGDPRMVRRVLRAFPAERTVAFFAELGVGVHEEEDGKLFPDTNRSRTILEALLAELDRCGVALEESQRVREVGRVDESFVVVTDSGHAYRARSVVLATGGRSLPKSGSDGHGYHLARQCGHGYIETTPALAPLLFDGDLHAALSGVSHPARLTLRVDGRTRIRLDGALLWTHFGASGPVVLNMSRHWLSARQDPHPHDTIELTASVCPGETLESIDEWLLEQQKLRPRARVATTLSARMPTAIADAWVAAAGIPAETTMAHLQRAGRRDLAKMLVDMPLAVRDSRGYTHAEVTAGGIPLEEVDHATMESRRCPGLYLVGEILDVDGRLGGFNFQWAWSSAWVAGQALARSLG
jgi:predicted Rossmann fold flavoprotein